MKLTKKILSEIEKEGITEDFLNQISFKENGIKVQLNPNDEVVEILPSGETCYIILSDGTTLKDEKGYVKISKTEALIGLARYLLNFKYEVDEKQRNKDFLKQKLQEEKFNKKVEEEIAKLKKITDKKLSETISLLKEPLYYSGLLELDGFEKTLFEIKKENHFNSENLISSAKEVCDESTLKLYNNLLKQEELGENKDYDNLYTFLVQGDSGLFQITSLELQKHDSILKKYFHRDNLEATIEMIKNQEHLKNVAIFNVEKRFNHAVC